MIFFIRPSKDVKVNNLTVFIPLAVGLPNEELVLFYIKGGEKLTIFGGISWGPF